MAGVTILIFAKYPQPGSVNTRMIPPLSPEQAAHVHVASLKAVCENVARLGPVDAKLVVTPDERTADLRRVAPACVTDSWPQGPGSLGDRLTRAVKRAFGKKADGVLLLGADSPTLPVRFLQDALLALDEHDAVLGPCDDGGYYLLGMKRCLPELLEGIAWGSSRVADQTRQRAAARGIDLSELPPWYDLDRFEDLERAARNLAVTTGPAATALCGLITRYIEGQP